MSRFTATSGLRAGITGVVGLACALTLSACVKGTTYGTGVSQEQQTINDLYNMFTLKSDKNNIDYSARPDLIVPQNTAALPEPVDSEVTTSNPDWPETPEQRIARIRSEAGEIDARSGDYSIEELQRRKEGIGVSQERRGKYVAGKTDRDGNPLLNIGETEEKRKAMLKAKAQLDYSRGVKRKYLSEPPIDYRLPTDSAPSGDQAFTEEELLKRQKEQEARERGYKEAKPFSSKD